jgi:hypothetical protein
MNVFGLTVCVGYAHLLKLSVERWANSLSSLLVVTDAKDTATVELCRQHSVAVHQTNVFYEHGAMFNKGAAIAEAYAKLPRGEWHLFVDADIIPPEDWLTQVQAQRPTPGNLYGAWRYQAHSAEHLGAVAQQRINDRELAGFFQLFHSSDPNARVRPIVDTHWTHAGCYDSYFAKRWQPQQRIILPLKTIHVGKSGQNWCGVGNAQAMAELMRQRIAHNGHQHERLK